MSGPELVIVCIFAIIGIVTCIFTLFRIVEWLCDNYDNVQLLCTHSNYLDDRIESIHDILRSQQDEIKILKERIDIYEKSNSKD